MAYLNDKWFRRVFRRAANPWSTKSEVESLFSLILKAYFRPRHWMKYGVFNQEWSGRSELDLVIECSPPANDQFPATWHDIVLVCAYKEQRFTENHEFLAREELWDIAHEASRFHNSRFRVLYGVTGIGRTVKFWVYDREEDGGGELTPFMMIFEDENYRLMGDRVLDVVDDADELGCILEYMVDNPPVS